jgi:hypothetical protein
MACRTRRLKEHFGSEYARVMEQTGNRSAAEASLSADKRRVAKLHVRQHVRDAQGKAC